MFDFVKCVAEAVAEHGVKGLVGMVPGGEFAYAVAGSALKKYKQRRDARKLREDMLAVALASGEQAGTAAVEAARAALAGKEATPEEVVGLELYLAAIPDAVRQSLKRPADPTGKTVPAEFALTSADDVVKLLPARPPRFRPGGPLPGKPGWVLERLLGVGGFGEVWLARHPRLASLSGAVKFCLGDTGRELIHEAGLIDRVMSAGRHPGIVPLTDCHLDGDAPWLMFEYVGGGTLTDWTHALAGKPPAERVKLVRQALGQLAGAVAHFHALTPPVVHRDLKPSNILLDRTTGRLRVTDFGIGSVTARETLRQEGRGQTSRGGVLLTGLRGSHTPLYASPQQRQGADPDPRDDVHALGVIGYQMLTGHLVQGAGPDFADDLREAGADEGLVALLGKCVAGKPERRPADAGEMTSELDSRHSERQETRTHQPAIRHSTRTSDGSRSRSDGARPSTMYELGTAYLTGRGVRRDDAEAAACLLRAAEAGDIRAMNALGWMHRDGRGVAQDDAQAVLWFRRAAEHDHDQAMYELGEMYATGRGVDRNRAEALAWWRRAAAAGNTVASNKLNQAGR